MLDRQHLMILREVRRTGSVTAAASALHLTQSALSHAVSKLEARHGVVLWQRRGRGLELTQAGAYLADLAERLVPEFAHAEQVLAGFAGGRRGLLRIGMECHPCEKWLMSVTAPYLAAWPDVEVEIRTAFRFDGVAALAAHEIDLLITPDPVQQTGLSFHPVFDYDLVLAVAPDHPLATRARIEAADLATQTLLTVPVDESRLDIFTRLLLPAGIRPAGRRTAETVELLLQLAAAGRGVAVLPDFLIDPPLVRLRIGRSGLAKSIHVGLRSQDDETDYIAGFLALARTVPQGCEVQA